MITRLPLVKNRRVPGRSIGPDSSGKEVKAGFVHKNQGAALTARLGFQVRPDFGSPAFDLLLIALDSPRDRQLGRPAQILEEARDVALMVGDTNGTRLS